MSSDELKMEQKLYFIKPQDLVRKIQVCYIEHTSDLLTVKNVSSFLVSYNGNCNTCTISNPILPI